MTLSELSIAELALGSLLVIAALVGSRFAAVASKPGGKVVLAFGALAGIGLIAWVAAPLVLSRLQSGGQAAVPAAPPIITAPSPSVAPPSPSAAAPSPTDLVQSASSELNACPVATGPELPDGARASREEMGAARRAFQAYDAATNAYTQCVDATIDRLAKQFSGEASAESLKALKAFGTNAHNIAVDKAQTLADQLNTQVRAYNAKHPPAPHG